MLRIFLTTDNHVGYNELDPVRGDDAARSFDEAMQLAVKTECDLVLQCGDLFHVNKPSKRSLYSVMKTLRRTCLGDKPIEFQVANHGSLALPDASEFNKVNFHDPNFNISLPFFAISGNHDDAGGTGGTGKTAGAAENGNFETDSIGFLSPLDVLSMSGLVNHFGRVLNSDNITITPLLFVKDNIKVAVYGLASVRDERLYRTFREKKVKFLRPEESPDEWFNIFMVHQNHAQHGATNYLPEQFIPNFMDLVIWGHEHECKIDPVWNPLKEFNVVQPGSTVITSLSESETGPKHAAVLTIGPQKSMSIDKYPLKSCRPFAFRTVVLEDAGLLPSGVDARAKTTEYLISQVEELIIEAQSKWQNTHLTSEASPLPLIRLRVDYSGGFEVENSSRFSKRFLGRVANTSDILHCFQKRETRLRIKPSLQTATDAPVNAVQYKDVSELAAALLESEELKILKQREMREALAKFVEKDDKLALKTSVQESVIKTINKLLDPINGIKLDDDDLDMDLSDENEDQSSRNLVNGTEEADAVTTNKPAPRASSRVQSTIPPNKSFVSTQTHEETSFSTPQSNLPDVQVSTRRPPAKRTQSRLTSLMDINSSQTHQNMHSLPPSQPSSTTKQANNRPEQASNQSSIKSFAKPPEEQLFVDEDSDDMFSD